jgi:Spy/CpxP family protein refolding chaperone
MTKFIALITAGLFAVGVAFAGEHGSCTKQVGNKENMAACQVSLASLDLTPDQKTKMDTLMTEHQKEGCTAESEAKYMKEAKRILNKEQYTKFKAECKKGEKEKSEA